MSEQTFADEIASVKADGVTRTSGFRVPPQHKAPGISAAILQGLMVLYAIVMVVVAYSNFAATEFLQGALDGEFASLEDYEAATAPLMQLFEILPAAVIGTFVASVIAYLNFVYQATRNLANAHAVGFTRTPWGAVGVSFIPFANLVMIYQVMRDIWVSSHDPRRGAYAASLLLAPWWILYLLAGIGGRVAESIATSAEERGDVDGLMTGVWLAIGIAVMLIISCVMLYLIVGSIVRAQAAWRDLPVSPAAEPPVTEAAPVPA
jgi:hypothetical protein